jgi:hypothetical protein
MSSASVWHDLQSVWSSKRYRVAPSAIGRWQCSHDQVAFLREGNFVAGCRRHLGGCRMSASHRAIRRSMDESQACNMAQGEGNFVAGAVGTLAW